MCAEARAYHRSALRQRTAEKPAQPAAAAAAAPAPPAPPPPPPPPAVSYRRPQKQLELLAAMAAAAVLARRYCTRHTRTAAAHRLHAAVLYGACLRMPSVSTQTGKQMWHENPQDTKTNTREKPPPSPHTAFASHLCACPRSSAPPRNGRENAVERQQSVMGRQCLVCQGNAMSLTGRSVGGGTWGQGGEQQQEHEECVWVGMCVWCVVSLVCGVCGCVCMCGGKCR